MSASVIRVLPLRVADTDCGGGISQSGSVHVVAVLLAWTPSPCSERTLSDDGFNVRFTFPAPGPAAPVKPCAVTESRPDVNVSLMPHTAPSAPLGPHAGVGVSCPKNMSAVAELAPTASTVAAKRPTTRTHLPRDIPGLLSLACISTFASSKPRWHLFSCR